MVPLNLLNSSADLLPIILKITNILHLNITKNTYQCFNYELGVNSINFLYNIGKMYEMGIR